MEQHVSEPHVTAAPYSVYASADSICRFAESEYWANNFNDLGSALVTLFELLMVNNWFVQHRVCVSLWSGQLNVCVAQANNYGWLHTCVGNAVEYSLLRNVSVLRAMSSLQSCPAAFKIPVRSCW